MQWNGILDEVRLIACWVKKKEQKLNNDYKEIDQY